MNRPRAACAAESRAIINTSMNDSDLNPYASPRTIASDAPRVPLIRWRIVPAALLWVVGGTFVAAGMVHIVVMTMVIHHQTDGQNWRPLGIPQLLANCTMALGAGVLLVVSGWFVWRLQFGRALLAFVGAIATPMVVFWVLEVFIR